MRAMILLVFHYKWLSIDCNRRQAFRTRSDTTKAYLILQNIACRRCLLIRLLCVPAPEGHPRSQCVSGRLKGRCVTLLAASRRFDCLPIHYTIYCNNDRNTLFVLCSVDISSEIVPWKWIISLVEPVVLPYQWSAIYLLSSLLCLL